MGKPDKTGSSRGLAPPRAVQCKRGTDSEMLTGHESCMQFCESFNLDFLFPVKEPHCFFAKQNNANCLCEKQLHTSELMRKIELLTEDSSQTNSLDT